MTFTSCARCRSPALSRTSPLRYGRRNVRENQSQLVRNAFARRGTRRLLRPKRRSLNTSPTPSCRAAGRFADRMAREPDRVPARRDRCDWRAASGPTGPSVAVAEEERQAARALLRHFRAHGAGSFATIEDLIVAPETRAAASARRCSTGSRPKRALAGFRRLFLESGVKNERAHDFCSARASARRRW